MKICIIIPFVFLLTFITGCGKNKEKEAAMYSKKLVELTHAPKGVDIDFKLLELSSKFDDPWVRKNCAGCIKFIGVDASNKDHKRLLKILESLATDSNNEVVEVAKAAQDWIEEVRKKE